MYITQTSALKPGSRLAKPVCNENGKILVGADVELTSSIIERLKGLGIKFVFVEDSRTDDLVIEDSVSDETRRRVTRSVRNAFFAMHGAEKRNRSSVFRLGAEFRAALELILHDLKNKKRLTINLSDISSSGDYLFSHSVNVGIYSVALGMAIGFNRKQLIELGVGALLHDIGKVGISSGILEKPGKLTPEEFDEIKKHTVYGYTMLRDQADIPLESAYCALLHHERIDGSGYPFGIEGNEIHKYAKIVGLVDMFDALVSNRSYRDRFLPHEAFEIMYTFADKFDIDIMTAFRNHTVIYPVGMLVSLNTGETGVVVDAGTNHPHRPVVRILRNEKGEDIPPVELDLSSHLSVMIVDCEPAYSQTP